MKNIIVLVLLFISTLSANDDIQMVKDNFLKTTNEVVNIIKTKDLTLDERNDQIVKTISPIFDFELMAKLSLGKKWKKLDDNTKKEFVKLYVQRMKKSYSEKIDKYTDEKIVIDDIKQIKKNRIVLTSTLVGKDENLEVIYKFYKPKKAKLNKARWLIYDVVISGVSIIKTDRTQFKAILQDETIYMLMDKLR